MQISAQINARLTLIEALVGGVGEDLYPKLPVTSIFFFLLHLTLLLFRTFKADYLVLGEFFDLATPLGMEDLLDLERSPPTSKTSLIDSPSALPLLHLGEIPIGSIPASHSGNADFNPSPPSSIDPPSPSGLSLYSTAPQSGGSGVSSTYKGWRDFNGADDKVFLIGVQTLEASPCGC